MATRYQHRIGIRSELFFDLILENPNPSAQELTQAVAQVLRQVTDADGGIKKLEDLSEATLYPDWNSVDAELEPDRALDPAAIRSVDCFEI